MYYEEKWFLFTGREEVLALRFAVMRDGMRVAGVFGEKNSRGWICNGI
jgi:hypothetical protein